MDDPVAVPLKGGPGLMFLFRPDPAAGILATDCVRGEPFLVLFRPLANPFLRQRSSSLLLSEVTAESLVSAWKRIRDDFGSGDDRHKIRVPFPTRHNMDVDVTRNASSPRVPDIHPDIEALGVKSLPQNLNGSIEHMKKIESFLILQFFQRRDVAIRHEQKMTVIVRIKVEHQESMEGTMHEKVFGIFFGRGAEGAAENASVKFFFDHDIFFAPRRPDLIHVGMSFSLP